MFFPPEHTPADKIPLLFFLHGSGEHTGNVTIDQAIARYGPLKNDQYTQKAVGDRFIIVFPQLPAPGGNIWGAYDYDIIEIVEEAWNKYGVDVKRTYLTGFSFGGNGVLSIASKQPDIWAALWPVDPTQRPLPKLKLPMWLSLGERSRGKDAEMTLRRLGFQEVKKENNDPNGTHLYADYGENHLETGESAYRDNRIYNWLLNNRQQ